MVRTSLFAAPASVLALPVVAAALVGCFIVAGGTAAYNPEVIPPEAGPDSCSPHAGICLDTTECISAANCAGEAGAPICCLSVTLSPTVVKSSCTTATSCSLGSSYQLCQSDGECENGGTCALIHCTAGEAELPYKTCGQSFCTQSQ